MDVLDDVIDRIKRQLANLIIKNMKHSKSGNHDRDEFDWEKHCRSTFPTPAAFVKFYKLTPNEFDSLRDKIAVYCKKTILYHPEVKVTPELMLSDTLRMSSELWMASQAGVGCICACMLRTFLILPVFCTIILKGKKLCLKGKV